MIHVWNSMPPFFFPFNSRDSRNLLFAQNHIRKQKSVELKLTTLPLPSLQLCTAIRQEPLCNLCANFVRRKNARRSDEICLNRNWSFFESQWRALPYEIKAFSWRLDFFAERAIFVQSEAEKWGIKFKIQEPIFLIL